MGSLIFKIRRTARKPDSDVSSMNCVRERNIEYESLIVFILVLWGDGTHERVGCPSKVYIFHVFLRRFDDDNTIYLGGWLLLARDNKKKIKKR